MKKLALILLILPFLSCEKQKEIQTYPNAQQLVLFQVEYINHAWGFSHSGFVIDSSGIVRTFKYPKNWHYPDSMGYISITDMNDNLQQLDTTSYEIDKNEMLKYFSMLGEISEGELFKPQYISFDAGNTDFSGFIFDENKQQYKHVLIRRVGDQPLENNSPESEEAFQWLSQIINIYKPLLK